METNPKNREAYNARLRMIALAQAADRGQYVGGERPMVGGALISKKALENLAYKVHHTAKFYKNHPNYKIPTGGKFSLKNYSKSLLKDKEAHKKLIAKLPEKHKALANQYSENAENIYKNIVKKPETNDPSGGKFSLKKYSKSLLKDTETQKKLINAYVPEKHKKLATHYSENAENIYNVVKGAPNVKLGEGGYIEPVKPVRQRKKESPYNEFIRQNYTTVKTRLMQPTAHNGILFPALTGRELQNAVVKELGRQWRELNNKPLAYERELLVPADVYEYEPEPPKTRPNKNTLKNIEEYKIKEKELMAAKQKLIDDEQKVKNAKAKILKELKSKAAVKIHFPKPEDMKLADLIYTDYGESSGSGMKKKRVIRKK